MNLILFSEWTASQRELWPLQILEVNGAALNAGESIELVGDLDVDAFLRASRQTVEECEVLRVRFREQGGEPAQLVAPLGKWLPNFVDLADNAAPSESAKAWIAAELARPLDISESVFSWTLIKLAETHHIWCLIVHQIVADGFSRNLVARRLAAIYSSLVGDDETTSIAPGPMFDLLREDAEYRQSEGFERSRANWLSRLRDLSPPARLTSRASYGSYMPARHTVPTSPSTSTAVRKIMADTGVSLSGLVVTLAAIYLRRLTGSSDITVGLLVAARTTPAARNTPGNVSNTVPARLKIDAETTLIDLITQVRARVREALSDQRVPLSDVKAGLPSLDGELYAIAVNVMKFDFALKFGTLRVATRNLSNGPVDDISISVFEQPGDGGLQIALNGNSSRYSRTELAAHYKWLMICLERLSRTDPTLIVDAIDWISPIDRDMLLEIGKVTDTREPMTVISDNVDVHEPNSEREVQICGAFARALAVNTFPADANFFDQGGHSLIAVRLISTLAKEFGSKIPLRALFENPTPRALTRYLSAPLATATLKSDLPLLVLCPGGGLLMREIIELRDALQSDFAVLVVEYPDWRQEWDVVCDVDRYLNYIVAQIRARAPEPRSLSLIGYSFGGSVAYALSVTLARFGYTIERLNIIDGYSPLMKQSAAANRRLNGIDDNSLVMNRLTPTNWFKRIVQIASRDNRRHQRTLGRLVGINAKKPFVKTALRLFRRWIPTDGNSDFLIHMTFWINASIPMQALRDWAKTIAPSDRLIQVPGVLFRSDETLDSWPRDLGWTKIAPNLEIVIMPGSHLTIINKRTLPVICSHVRLGRAKPVVVESRLDVLAPLPDASGNGPALRGLSMPELRRDELLSEIFAAAVRRTPTAVCMTTRLMETLTYAEVDARATAIARGLVKRGAKAGQVIGLWQKAGVDVLISQIAIAKTGATWLPFDAAAPAARVAACLSDASAILLLADRERLQRAAGVLRCPAVDPALIVDGTDNCIIDARALGATPEHAAYIIYTSGSTGEPKGIVVSNRNICHFLRAMNEVYGIVKDDVMFQNASLAFDLSMEQIWLPYLVGASLFVSDEETIGEIDELPRYLEQAGVTVLDTLPTLLALLPRDVETLRMIILGGEACTPAIAKGWAREGRAFYNTYGPTETTVVATASRLCQGKDVTIGRPIPNYSCYVVDNNLVPVKVGEEGELLIGGPGVATGYLGRDELNKRNFIANPFDHDGPDPILYRTGDLVTVEPNGEVAFRGRIDDQIKIRGFRVELGEIDACLCNISGIYMAATVLLNEGGSDQLAAFLVADAEIELSKSNLRATLQKRLPAHMVPTRFERVTQLPRLHSGKIDRKALAKSVVLGSVT
jgi:amino acid adenylation domain-containing protein